MAPSPEKMSLRQLKEEVLSLSSDIQENSPNKSLLSDRLNKLIGTIELMKEERLGKIKSLPNSLHSSPDHKLATRRTATSALISRNKPQESTPIPSVSTKRQLFSPDSDDDEGSPTKSTSYLQTSPDPAPRSPSVTRNPLFDSPDPYLTGEPGDEIVREAIQVQSLAGMLPILDLSSAAINGNDASFTWQMEPQPPHSNEWMFKIMQELTSLKESQALIMRALERPPLSPFSIANEGAGESSKGVHFLASNSEDYSENKAGGSSLKPQRSFRIRHDATGIHKKEIETPPISRAGSFGPKPSGSTQHLLHLGSMQVTSNEDKLQMDHAASIIQRHFRRFQAKKRGVYSDRMTQQLQKVQVIAQMINLSAEAKSHTSKVVEERTGVTRRVIRNESIISSESNADLWSKARTRIERLRDEELAIGEDIDTTQLPSYVKDSRDHSSVGGGAGLSHSSKAGPPFTLMEAYPAIQTAVSFISLSLSFLLIIFDLLSSLLRPITNPLKAWTLLQYQRLSNSADVRVRGLVLVAISLTLVSIGALAYHLTTGASWPSSFFYVYSILFNVPGLDITVEHSIPGLILTNCIFLVGVLVFAVLLGMIGEEVANQIVMLRSGTGPLKLNGHILVLNCSNDLVPLLEQIQLAGMNKGHIFSGRSIVILADLSKEDLERKKKQCLAYVESKRGSKGIMDIHTRSGQPYSYDDLALVSAQTAQFIVLLYPPITSSASVESESITTSQRLRLSNQANLEESKAESLKAATVAAMSTLGRSKNQNLVVQVPLEVKPEHSQLEVVNDLLRDEEANVSVCRIPEVKVIDRLISQTALQPGELLHYMQGEAMTP